MLAGAALPSHLDCCGGLSNLDYSKVDLSTMTLLLGYVKLSDSTFAAAVLCIAFNPLFWNVPFGFFFAVVYQAILLSRIRNDAITMNRYEKSKVARWEHKTRVLSRACGSPSTACYCLGAVILLLNFIRSHCFMEALRSQPKLEGLDCLSVYYAGLAVLGIGFLFVISSFLALGFIGTFLGDYFGILKEEKVTSFPFNVMDNPMYWGSTACYLGWSIMHVSPAGILLTAVVAVSYMIAILYEGPFTEEIYQQKQKATKNK